MPTGNRKSTAKKTSTRRSPLPESARFLRRTNLAVRDTLSAAETAAAFSQQSVGVLTLDERKLIVEQALILMAENFVHLPQKRSLYAADPVQALKNLRYRLDTLTPATMGDEMAFHGEMLRIFASVRDLHTVYQLPSPYKERTAILPFDIEEYFVGDVPHYQVSHVVEGFSHPNFVPGVEVLAWSGAPIERAIAVNADRRGGTNPAARKARGIQYLTLRPLLKSVTPDEAWVEIDYLDLSGAKQTLRFDWMIIDVPPATPSGGTSVEEETMLGVDIELEAATQVKRILFAPQTLDGNRARRRRAAADGAIETSLPAFMSARTVQTTRGPVGHLRIYSFSIDPVVLPSRAFVDEVERLVGLMPQDKLILDVRGNPGGIVTASEGLLQMFTPRRITPAPNQFIVTPLNRQIVFANQGAPRRLGAWLPSMDEAKFTSAVYSATFSLTSEAEANERGQKYRGRVICITDARCFSATDILAAGIQDHEICTILGVDDNTGAGGANVWKHAALLSALAEQPAGLPPSPYKPLPGGLEMRVAMRRTLRVGKYAGAIVEDLGVKPNARWKLTRNDLLNGNIDLIEHAAGLLDAQPLRTLELVAGAVAGGELSVSVATGNITRLDIFADGTPFGSRKVSAGTIVVKVPASATLLRFEGYDRGKLVVSNQLRR